MFTDTELIDPAPPTPGAAERAKVATRATQIKRNRRFAAAGGALGLVAVLSLGAVAVSGGSSGSGTSRVEVAGAVAERETATTAAPVATTVAPAPTVVTEAPAPAVDDSQATTQEAPAVQETPAPAATYTVSGTIPGYPTDVMGTVRLVGDAGTFTAPINADGSFSISGVPAGHYSADYSWTSSDGSASQVGRAPGGVDINGDGSISFG